MICKVLRMFVNIFTADYKYCLLNRDNLREPIQTELSKKQKTFSQFVAAFLKYRLNFEQFLRKMTFITDVFPKLRTPKNVVK